MKCFQVHEDTDIADYVRHSTTLHDDTVVHSFSKELSAFLETLVDFSPYYSCDNPRASGAMNTYYTDTLRDYWKISFDTLHSCLIDELTDWYQRFPPAKAVGSCEEPAGGAKVGDVVELDYTQATSAFSVGRKRSAAVEGPAGAGGQPAPAAAAAAATPAAPAPVQ